MSEAYTTREALAQRGWRLERNPGEMTWTVVNPEGAIVGHDYPSFRYAQSMAVLNQQYRDLYGHANDHAHD